MINPLGKSPHSPSPVNSGIAPGSLAHREIVIEIVTASLRSFGLVPDMYSWDSEIFLFGQNPPCIREFVALESMQVVGVGVLEYLEDSKASVRHLYVAETARRSGHGRRLLSHMTQHAHEQGIKELELNTRATFTAAIALYESGGWTPVVTEVKNSGPELTYRFGITQQHPK
jgi:ribosomal protein S18 acetylase RimI-like enzyme